jgi:RNA-binding protein YlmH
MNEEAILKSRIYDYIDRAKRANIPVYTNFLNPNQQSLAIDILNATKGIEYQAFGGADGCERRVFAITSVFCDIPPNFDCICVLKITFDKFNEKWNVHRSVLGAILGLGHDRRVVGDVLTEGLFAYVFVLDTAASYIKNELVSVGRASVSLDIIDACDADIKIKAGEMKKKTVSSLRLDAVLCAAMNLSRGKAMELIKSEVVFVNFRLTKKAEVGLSEGDIVSVRKKGRFILNSIGNKSAKGRVWIELVCFFV